MTTYNTVPDSVLALDKPVRASDIRKLRDNLLAVIEADASAPRIDPDAIAKTGTKPLMVVKFGGRDMPASVTRWLTAIGQNLVSSEAAGEYFCIRPVTLKHLHVKSNAVLAGGDVTATLRKNGADTSIAATISAGSSTASETANSITLGVGDRFSIKLVSGALSVGTTDFFATISAYKPGTDEGAPWIPYGAPGIPYTGGAGSVGELGTVPAAENHAEVPLPECYVGHNRYGYKAGTDILTPRKNAVTVNAMSTVEARAGYYFSAGDLFNLYLPSGGSGHEEAGGVMVEAVDPNAYPPAMTFFSSRTQLQSTTFYMGGWCGTSSATENEAQIPMPACTVKNLRVCVDTAPTQNCTYTLRKNGVDTGLTVTVNGSRTGADLDPAHAVTFAAGDLLSLKIVSGATGTRSYSAGVEITV